MARYKPRLEPADRKRCQAEEIGGSFMTLGPRPRTRCSNVPKYIAKEKKSGSDGQQGSMSLCEACKGHMIKQLGKDFAVFIPIRR